MEEKKKRRRNTKQDWRTLLERYRDLRDKHQERLEKEKAAIDQLNRAIEETERLALRNIMTTYEMTPEKLEETLKNQQPVSLAMQKDVDGQNSPSVVDESQKSDKHEQSSSEQGNFLDPVSDSGKETLVGTNKSPNLRRNGGNP